MKLPDRNKGLKRKKAKAPTFQPGSKIFRDADRIKKNSEIFTPAELVNKMLDKVAEFNPDFSTKLWNSTLDPACGSGNFLVEALRRKLASGQPVQIALMNIYGIDIMQDNVDECKQRLLEIAGAHDRRLYGLDDRPDYDPRAFYGTVVDMNIICGDALKDETYSRFFNWEAYIKEKFKLDDEGMEDLDGDGPLIFNRKGAAQARAIEVEMAR